MVLTLSASVLEQNVTIKLIADDALENDETFLVALKSDDPAVIVNPGDDNVTITIIDNDRT